MTWTSDFLSEWGFLFLDAVFLQETSGFVGQSVLRILTQPYQKVILGNCFRPVYWRYFFPFLSSPNQSEIPLMPSKFAPAVCALVVCALFIFSTVGCKTETTPVQTTADELDQYLADNPDEAYSSDGVAEEMTADEGDGEGDDDSGEEATE